MAGYAIHGSTNLTTGAEFFYPEWFAQLYPRLGGAKFKNIYLAGWMDEAGCALVDGASNAQMQFTRVGDDPVVSNVSALNNRPAFTAFDGARRIDTGHNGGTDFTLIGLVEITADMLDGVGSTNNRLFSRVFGATDMAVGVAGIGSVYFHLDTNGSIITVPGANVTPGPKLIMATCRQVSTNVFDIKLFIDNLITPAAQNNSLAHTYVAGGTWQVGSIDSVTFWRGSIAGWMILDGDITQDAAAYTTIKNLLPDAKAWMTPA